MSICLITTTVLLRFVFRAGGVVRTHVHGRHHLQPATLSPLLDVRTRRSCHPAVVPPRQRPRPLAWGRAARPPAESRRVPALTDQRASGTPAVNLCGPRLEPSGARRRSAIRAVDVPRTSDLLGIGSVVPEPVVLPVSGVHRSFGRRRRSERCVVPRPVLRPPDTVLLGSSGSAQIPLRVSAESVPRDPATSARKRSFECPPVRAGGAINQLVVALAPHGVFCTRAGWPLCHRSQWLPDSAAARPIRPVRPLLWLLHQPAGRPFHLRHLQQLAVLPGVHRRVHEQVQIGRSCVTVLGVLCCRFSGNRELPAKAREMAESPGGKCRGICVVRDIWLALCIIHLTCYLLKPVRFAYLMLSILSWLSFVRCRDVTRSLLTSRIGVNAYMHSLDLLSAIMSAAGGSGKFFSSVLRALTQGIVGCWGEGWSHAWSPQAEAFSRPNAQPETTKWCVGVRLRCSEEPLSSFFLLTCYVS